MSAGASGLRLKRCAPHSGQKDFSNPPSGCLHPRTTSAPATRRNAFPSTTACADEPDPVRPWQRVQWQ